MARSNGALAGLSERCEEDQAARIQYNQAAVLLPGAYLQRDVFSFQVATLRKMIAVVRAANSLFLLSCSTRSA